MKQTVSLPIGHSPSLHALLLPLLAGQMQRTRGGGWGVHSEPLEGGKGGKATRWKDPGSLSDCVEQDSPHPPYLIFIKL